ncbi:MAG TPA: ABC transporter permease [Clostridiales bacterium]|nr:ABC transporter permease [Clostridiales bacterium]
MSRLFDNFNKYRFLLVELIKKDIKLKYRRSYLGILWTLLEPLLTTAVLTFVFGGLLGKGGRTFPVYILSGRLLYSFFAGSTKAAMKSIRKNSGMIKKVYVPKYIYPFSTILSNYVIFLISLVVLFASLFVFDINVTFHILWALVPLLLLLILGVGIGMILATLAVFFRDLEYLWSVFLMIVMYTSAIFYHVDYSSFGEKVWLFNLNPLYLIIMNFRNAVFGTPIDIKALLLTTIYSFGSLIIGIIFFYKQQDKFIMNI